MRAGFNWEMGPFQLWDAAGVSGTVERMRAARRARQSDCRTPAGRGRRNLVRAPRPRVLRCGTAGPTGQWPRPKASRASRDSARPTAWCKHNPGASLVDLGDGVACLELHSKKNAIGEDIVRLVTETCAPASEAVRELRGLRDQRRCRAFLRRRQPDAASVERPGRRVGRRGFRRARLPAHDRVHQVLPAPGGGGAVFASAWAAARRSPCTARAARPMPNCTWGWWKPASACCPPAAAARRCCCAPDREDGRESVELTAALRRTFETIAMAKVSTSAVEARHLGMLLPADRITMNRERLLNDAKQSARALAARRLHRPRCRAPIFPRRARACWPRSSSAST